MLTNTTDPVLAALPIILHEDVLTIVERLDDTLARYELANGIDLVAGTIVEVIAGVIIATAIVLAICPFSGDARVVKWEQVN
jgi:hypothetical protein